MLSHPTKTPLVLVYYSCLKNGISIPYLDVAMNSMSSLHHSIFRTMLKIEYVPPSIKRETLQLYDQL